jgi:hypothetical protein
MLQRIIRGLEDGKLADGWLVVVEAVFGGEVAIHACRYGRINKIELRNGLDDVSRVDKRVLATEGGGKVLDGGVVDVLDNDLFWKDVFGVLAGEDSDVEQVAGEEGG